MAALRDHGTNGLCVTDLARYTGIQRPTIYRLMAALMEAGLAHPVAGTKRYRAQLAQDAGVAEADPRLRQTLPALRRLAERTGDAVFLVVRDGDESVSLHREIGGYPVQILATYAGKRQPAGRGLRRHGAAGGACPMTSARHRRAQCRAPGRIRRHDRRTKCCA